VKEIYDACHELEQDPANVILNQFCEYGNHLVHRIATGRAAQRVVSFLNDSSPNLKPRAFVSASGSAGTIGAGDYLKEQFGSITVAVEALECPTLLYNGYGEHNIQGIGDKHVPLIHNVMNTDVVAAVSDKATDCLNVLANTEAGRTYLHGRGVDKTVIDDLDSFGLSSWCNVLAAIKVAKHFRYGPDDLIVTVATDGAALYRSERDRVLAERYADGFERAEAAAVMAEHLDGQTDDHLLDCTDVDRNRIFNLGYFTWVEQQGLALEDFEARRSQRFWRGLLDLVPMWDAHINELNARSGVPGA
jgi:hypothetical protein